MELLFIKSMVLFLIYYQHIDPVYFIQQWFILFKIEAIQLKYQNLEEELIKTRRSTQEEMLVFMEEEVGTKLSNLSNLRVRTEARLRHNHQVSKAQPTPSLIHPANTRTQIM